MEFIEIEEKVAASEQKLFHYERNFNGTKSDRDNMKVILDRLRYGIELNDDSGENVAPNNPPEHLKRFIQVPKESFYKKNKQEHTTKVDQEGGTLVVSAEASLDDDGKKSLKISGLWNGPGRIECGIKFGKEKGSLLTVDVQGRVSKYIPFKRKDGKEYLLVQVCIIKKRKETVEVNVRDMRRDLDMVDKLVNKIDKQIKGMFMPSKKDFYNRGQKQPKVLFPAALDESDESETGEFIIRQDLDNDEW